MDTYDYFFMGECDFFFRGELLSGYGYTLCSFDGSSVSTITTDSQRDFTTTKLFMGKYHPIVYYTYNSALVMEMSICKSDTSSDGVITPAEASSLKKWLEAPTPQEFRIGTAGYENCFWNGTFNVKEIRSYSDIVGFRLTFTATAPFGYKDAVEFSGEVSENETITIDDNSDEEGYIYPDISLTLQSSGTLTITNAFDGRQTIVYNCTSGETIAFTHLLQVVSSNDAHALGDDFNYKFLRICNTYKNTLNEITFSLPCTYSISYNPIAKVVA